MTRSIAIPTNAIIFAAALSVAACSDDPSAGNDSDVRTRFGCVSLDAAPDCGSLTPDVDEPGDDIESEIEGDSEVFPDVPELPEDEPDSKSVDCTCSDDADA